MRWPFQMAFPEGKHLEASIAAGQTSVDLQGVVGPLGVSGVLGRKETGLHHLSLS
jgi:hypothetical protein